MRPFELTWPQENRIKTIDVGSVLKVDTQKCLSGSANYIISSRFINGKISVSCDVKKVSRALSEDGSDKSEQLFFETKFLVDVGFLIKKKFSLLISSHYTIAENSIVLSADQSSLQKDIFLEGCRESVGDDVDANVTEWIPSPQKERMCYRTQKKDKRGKLSSSAETDFLVDSPLCDISALFFLPYFFFREGTKNSCKFQLIALGQMYKVDCFLKPSADQSHQCLAKVYKLTGEHWKVLQEVEIKFSKMWSSVDRFSAHISGAIGKISVSRV